jgi:hypothetical protein
MAIFNRYVNLPEGKNNDVFFEIYILDLPLVQKNVFHLFPLYFCT